MEVGGFEDTASRVEIGASCPFEWMRLRPQDTMLLAIHNAVRELVGPVPTNCLIELRGGMTPPHDLHVQLHPGRRASAGDCPETTRANGVGFPLSPKQICLRSYQW